MARYVRTCAWRCRKCGQHGISWPGRFLATFRAHWEYAHDPIHTDTTISIFARTR